MKLFIYLVIPGLAVAAASGCVITTPKGAYSFAIQGDQIGIAKDIAVALANTAQEIHRKEVELQLAQQTAKPDKIRQITDLLATLRDRQAKLKEQVQQRASAAQAALQTANAG